MALHFVQIFADRRLYNAFTVRRGKKFPFYRRLAIFGRSAMLVMFAGEEGL
jgi:hypothetical protein